VPQNPVLLKPADVPNFPDGRLDKVTWRAEQLLVGEAAHQAELDRTRIGERVNQHVVIGTTRVAHRPSNNKVSDTGCHVNARREANLKG
jgi:hypothetical protein